MGQCKAQNFLFGCGSSWNGCRLYTGSGPPVGKGASVSTAMLTVCLLHKYNHTAVCVLCIRSVLMTWGRSQVHVMLGGCHNAEGTSTHRKSIQSVPLPPSNTYNGLILSSSTQAESVSFALFLTACWLTPAQHHEDGLLQLLCNR